MSFNVSLWSRIVIDGEESAYAAYKKVMHRMHPDRGGFVADTQRLQATKEEWDKAEADKGTSGKEPKGTETRVSRSLAGLSNQFAGGTGEANPSAV